MPVRCIQRLPGPAADDALSRGSVVTAAPAPAADDALMWPRLQLQQRSRPATCYVTSIHLILSSARATKLFSSGMPKYKHPKCVFHVMQCPLVYIFYSKCKLITLTTCLFDVFIVVKHFIKQHSDDKKSVCASQPLRAPPWPISARERAHTHTHTDFSYQCFCFLLISVNVEKITVAKKNYPGTNQLSYSRTSRTHRS